MGEKLDSGFHIGALLSGEGLGPEKVVTNISENISQSSVIRINKRIMIYTYSELFINPGIVRVQGPNNWIQFSTVTFDSIFSWFFSPSLSLQKVLVTV